jgi:protein involved in polysaccharide export with SLBB domain
VTVFRASRLQQPWARRVRACGLFVAVTAGRLEQSALGVGGLAAGALVATGCAAASQRSQLPPAIESTKVYDGDELEIWIVGQEHVPRQFTVAADGTIDPPMIKRIKVGGLEPQEIQALVRERLVAEGMLLEPSVSVRVTQYKSRKVEVLGEVQRASSVALDQGMTVLRAITSSGGFTNLADRSRIRLRRKTASGVVEVYLNESDSFSVVLQAGDSITVEQRTF